MSQDMQIAYISGYISVVEGFVFVVYLKGTDIQRQTKTAVWMQVSEYLEQMLIVTSYEN